MFSDSPHPPHAPFKTVHVHAQHGYGTGCVSVQSRTLGTFSIVLKSAQDSSPAAFP